MPRRHATAVKNLLREEQRSVHAHKVQLAGDVPHNEALVTGRPARDLGPRAQVDARGGASCGACTAAASGRASCARSISSHHRQQQPAAANAAASPRCAAPRTCAVPPHDRHNVHEARREQHERLLLALAHGRAHKQVRPAVSHACKGRQRV